MFKEAILDLFPVILNTIKENEEILVTSHNKTNSRRNQHHSKNNEAIYVALVNR